MTLEEIKFIAPKRHPLLIVISGPSGVGKDTVLRELIKQKDRYAFVITATSRQPRPGEVDGVDYFFVTRSEFERMIDNDELIEFNKVYSDYKGIPRRQVAAALATGKDAVVRVDVQGAARLRTLYPQALLIFLIPENSRVWYHRLLNRKTETPEELAVRIQTAKEEVGKIGIFDYVVTNAEDHLMNTVSTIESIILAEHHKVNHRKLE